MFQEQIKDILIALSDLEFFEFVLWEGKKRLVMRLNAASFNQLTACKRLKLGFYVTDFIMSLSQGKSSSADKKKVEAASKGSSVLLDSLVGGCEARTTRERPPFFSFL